MESQPYPEENFFITADLFNNSFADRKAIKILILSGKTPFTT